MSDKSKVDRSAFLYLEHDEKSIGESEKFAQCSTCALWTGERKRCFILGTQFEVLGTDSCGLYCNGDNQSDILSKNEIPTMTPKDAGFYRGKTRCENCRSFNKEESTCELYKAFNKKFSDFMDLKEKVSSVGCCNAFMPKTEKSQKKKHGGILSMMNKKVTLEGLF